MNRNDIAHLLTEAMRLTHHRDYVIIGSLSVLGALANPPVAMTGSIDVDLYPKNAQVVLQKLPNRLAWAARLNVSMDTMPTRYRPCYPPCRKAGSNG